MTDEKENVTLHQVDGYELAEAHEKASTDVQISTAKQYPRDLKKATDDAVFVATIDKETAESCGYALPRGGKTITGPSVHLARIIAQSFGNMRVQYQVKHVLAKNIVAEAVCWDLEKNYAVKAEVRKKITDRYGKRYNDDMIVTAGNAASAIAERNAILRVVPSGVVQKVYKESRNKLTGDLSDEAKLVQARKQAFDSFKDNYGVTDEQILEAVGVKTMNAVKQDHIIRLREFWQAIKDGDTSAEEVFNLKKEEKEQEQKAEEKDNSEAKNKVNEAMKSSSQKSNKQTKIE